MEISDQSQTPPGHTVVVKHSVGLWEDAEMNRWSPPSKQSQPNAEMISTQHNLDYKEMLSVVCHTSGEEEDEKSPRLREEITVGAEPEA